MTTKIGFELTTPTRADIDFDEIDAAIMAA